MQKLLRIGLLALLASCSNEPSPFDPVTANPDLPTVLLIGDSISISYTLPVRSLLDAKFNVERVPVNSTNSARLLAGLDEWLTRDYDVIHFNAGLHDMKYVADPSDKMTEQDGVEGGKRWVEPDAYEANLRAIVQRLKARTSRIVVATTTPVPEGARARMPADVERYNEIAERVAKDEDLCVDDLNEFITPFLAAAQKPRDVHFREAGNWLLAGQVSHSILDCYETKVATAQAP